MFHLFFFFGGGRGERRRGVDFKSYIILDWCKIKK